MYISEFLISKQCLPLQCPFWALYEHLLLLPITNQKQTFNWISECLWATEDGRSRAWLCSLLTGKSTAMRTVSREAAGPEAEANTGKIQLRITESFRLEETFKIINPPVYLSACHTHAWNYLWDIRQARVCCFHFPIAAEVGRMVLGVPVKPGAAGTVLNCAFQVGLQKGAFLKLTKLNPRVSQEMSEQYFAEGIWGWTNCSVTLLSF